MGKLWWNKENEDESENEGETKLEVKPMTHMEKYYDKRKRERKIKNYVFHDVISKSLKKIKEILEDATKETSYEFEDIYELLGKYVTDERDAGNSIIRNIIDRLKAFQSQYREQAMIGYEAEILIRAIENLRTLINELVAIIGSEDKELPLKRLMWRKLITSEEFDELEHELSPESIKKILKKRKVVNYDTLNNTGQLKLIME